MTDNAFDKFIHDKLKDYPSAVPADMWERIQPKKDDRKGGFWTNNPLRIFLLVTALSGVIYLISTNTGTSVAFTNSSNNTPDNTSDASSSLKLKQQEQISTTPSTAKQSGTSSEEISTTSATDRQSAKSIEEVEKISSNPSSKNLIDRNADIENIFGGNKKWSKKDLYQSIGNKNAAQSERSNIIVNDILETGNYSGGVYERGFIVNEKKVLPGTQNNKELSNYLKNYLFASGIDCPSINDRKRSDLYLEVFASPDYGFKKVSGNTSLDPAYLQKKDSSETMGISFSAGFRLTKSLGENLRLKTGLQYSQINERFNLRSENERRLKTVVTVRTIIRSAGDTLIFRDTSTVEEIGYVVKTTRNRFRSIDVPLLVGYEWGNEYWKAAVTTGVILNVRSWQKGATLDTNYTAVDFNKSNGQFFKKNIGIGIYAGFSILKSIGERTELFAEPHFRYNISNMTNQGAFNQKIHLAGLNLGIRYKIRSAGQR